MERLATYFTNRENEKCKWNNIDLPQVVARWGGDRQNIIIQFLKYLVGIGNEAWLNLFWDYINGKLFAVCCKERLATYCTNRENEKCKWNIIDLIQVVARRGDRQNIIIMFWKYLVDVGNEAWLNPF
jgi:hypothetical protein